MKARIAVIGLKGLPASGGAATVGENLIQNLKERFEFEVLSTASHATEKMVNGIPQIIFASHPNPKINTFLYYLRCAIFVLFQRKYDLLHLHHAESGFIVPMLRFRYKVVTTYHGMFLDSYFDPKFSRLTNRFFGFSQWLNLKFANVSISVSGIDAEKINRMTGRELVRYIPNGILLPIEKPRIKKSGYICFAANRIYQIKGLHTLIEAFRITGLQKQLKVIGDLAHNPEYKHEIEYSSKDLNVEFVGKINEKNALFALISGSDYFIFPSEKEAMSMMLLEVVALQIPIIASDIESIKAIFNENELIFFQSKNSKDLADKIQKMESDPAIGITISKNAYRKVANEYQWREIAEQYSDIYQKLLS